MMVLVCMERNEVERNTTFCVGRLTIIAIMLLAAAERRYIQNYIEDFSTNLSSFAIILLMSFIFVR